MKIDKKTILQTLIFTLAGIALIVWRYQTLTKEDKDAMFRAFSAFRWEWALPIFIAGLVSHILRAKRWELQFRALQIPSNSFNTFSAVMIGYLTNIFIPRLGEVSKCTVAARYSGGAVDKIIGTVIAERLWDTICFGILTLLTLVIEADVMMPYASGILDTLLLKFRYPDGSFNWFKITVLTAVLFAGCVLLFFLFKKFRNGRIGGFIQGLGKGLQSVYKLPQKGLFMFYSIAMWGCYILVAVLVLKAIPATEHLPLSTGLSIITFGTFAMIIPAPGAIAYPLIVAPVLTLYGTSAGVGQGYGWINWANQNITVIILGLFAMIALPVYNSKNKRHDQIRNSAT